MKTEIETKLEEEAKSAYPVWKNSLHWVQMQNRDPSYHCHNPPTTWNDAFEGGYLAGAMSVMKENEELRKQLANLIASGEAYVARVPDFESENTKLKQALEAAANGVKPTLSKSTTALEVIFTPIIICFVFGALGFLINPKGFISIVNQICEDRNVNLTICSSNKDNE